MTRILEVDDQGMISLPADLLGHAASHTKYQVERHEDELVLRRTDEKDDSQKTLVNPPKQKHWDWLDTHGPGLPAEAYSREHIYD